MKNNKSPIQSAKLIAPLLVYLGSTTPLNTLVVVRVLVLAGVARLANSAASPVDTTTLVVVGHKAAASRGRGDTGSNGGGRGRGRGHNGKGSRSGLRRNVDRDGSQGGSSRGSGDCGAGGGAGGLNLAVGGSGQLNGGSR